MNFKSEKWQMLQLLAPFLALSQLLARHCASYWHPCCSISTDSYSYWHTGFQ